MSRFILKLSSFIAVFAVLITLSSISVIYIQKQSLNNCRLPDNTDSLLIGDSHTMWAINDAEIPGLRNLSLNAEGYKYSLKKLEHLLRSGMKPETVYVGFSYHNLSGYYDQYISGALFKHFFTRYIPLMGPEEYIQLLQTNRDDWVGIFRKLILEAGKQGILGRCMMYGGFPEKKLTQVYSRESMRKRISAQFYNQSNLFEQSLINREYLIQIVNLCRSLDIDIVLVNTPLHPEYKKLVPIKYVKIYDSFIEQYGLEVYEFGGIRLGEEHYLPDGDHINSAGAALVTQSFKAFYEQR